MVIRRKVFGKGVRTGFQPIKRDKRGQWNFRVPLAVIGPEAPFGLAADQPRRPGGQGVGTCDIWQ